MVPISKLRNNTEATATLVLGVSFQKRNASWSSNMSISNSNITTGLISDFAGGRLDAEDAQIIQEAIDHDEVIATAVLDARRVASRMNVWLAMPALATPAPGADRTRAVRLQ
jgi:hypothetical protein